MTGNDNLDQKNEWESYDIENQEQKIQSSIAQGAIPGLGDKESQCGGRAWGWPEGAG